MVNARQLQYVIALSRVRNFSAVAEKLNISQPALSKQILSLEKELGVKLFDRSENPLSLTPAGEEFIRQAQELLYQEDQLKRSMEQFRSGEAGRLTIGISPFRSMYLLSDMVKKVREKYPSVQITLCEAPSDQLRKEAAEGKYDFAIVNLPVDEAALAVTPLEPDVVVLAEIYAARELVNISNTQTGDGLLSWEYISVAPVALQAPGNIEYAVQHPTTFLGCRTDIPIGEYVFDWYLQQDLPGQNGYMMQSQSDLWGYAVEGADYKTIFDPCPPGWAVPPYGAFGEIPEGYAASYEDRSWEKEAYGWTWKGGNGDFFPSSGNLDVSGLMGETSEKLLYWTAETFGSEAKGFGKAANLFVAYNEVYYGIYPILDPAEAAAWYSYGAKCCAASVRCVKENN